MTTIMKTFIQYIKKPGIVMVLLLTALVSNQQGSAQTVVVNPTNPWVVPAGVTSIKVEVWGAGGGGGGAASFGTSGGGGGGGGAYNTATFNVLPGQSYTITRGAAGAAGTNAPGAGGTGGTSTVTGTGGTISAPGGAGGAAGSDGNNGVGGNGGTGLFAGGKGGNSSGNGAGGGGAAGNAGAGTVGNNAATGAGGIGSPNISPYIGGAGGTFRTSTGAGNGGVSPGGGGGGARAAFSTAAGGAGALGQVIITYCATAAPTVTGAISYCQFTTATALTAAGTSLLWYTTETGGVGSATAPTPSTTTAGVTTYYVSQTIGCEGPRAAITVTVRPRPTTAVTGQSNLNCFAASDGTITIQGNGGTSPYTYSVNNGASYEPGTNPHTVTGLNANTVYKIRVKDNSGCESTLIP